MSFKRLHIEGFSRFPLQSSQSFLSAAGDGASSVCHTVPHTRPLLVETMVPHQKVIMDEGGTPAGIPHCSDPRRRSRECRAASCRTMEAKTWAFFFFSQCVGFRTSLQEQQQTLKPVLKVAKPCSYIIVTGAKNTFFPISSHYIVKEVAVKWRINCFQCLKSFKMTRLTVITGVIPYDKI